MSFPLPKKPTGAAESVSRSSPLLLSPLHLTQVTEQARGLSAATAPHAWNCTRKNCDLGSQSSQLATASLAALSDRAYLARERPHPLADSVEQYLEGNPWEGQQDLAREGLREWQADIMRNRGAVGIQDDVAKLLADSPGRPLDYNRKLDGPTERLLQPLLPPLEDGCCEIERLEVVNGHDRRSTVSTDCSEGSCEPSRVSATSLSSTSSMSAPSPCLPSSNVAVRTSEPIASRGEDADFDEDSDDWELEFMLRSGMKFERIVDHVLGSGQQ